MALSNEVRRLERSWANETAWPKRLEWIEIKGLRGWSGQRAISFDGDRAIGLLNLGLIIRNQMAHRKEPTPHEEVIALLGKMRDALANPLQFQTLSDELSVLTSAYMVPTVIDPITDQIHLTKSQARVFNAMRINLGKVMGSDALMNALSFDKINDPGPKIIDVHICRIRQKIKKYGAPFVVETIWGQGYKMVATDRDASNPSIVPFLPMLAEIVEMNRPK